ncbi:MAG: polyphosphate:AMP phosphotransferase [Planctomycetota bacterium]|nr:MAG: polyphosphate:AMP phosphotransferase [Planctomycetota bacterium]
MFACAEVGRTVDKKEYNRRLPKLREELLEVQGLLRESDFPVIVIFGGVDGGGKGESANYLSEWMDAHWLRTVAYDPPTTEEKERPRFWRYWRDLPPRGQIGIFLSSWYHSPLLNRVHGKSKLKAFQHSLREIRSFERTLADDGALIIKFWMHLGKDAQKKRFLDMENDPLLHWRVTERDWEHWRMYDQFVSVSETLIQETDLPEAPWKIIEGADPHFYGLEVGETILKRIRQHLKKSQELAKKRKKEPVKPGTRLSKKNALKGIDLEKSLEKKPYQLELERWQGRLNLLHRQAREKGIPMVLAFEGWDAGGKGGAIRRITAALDSRSYKVFPISAPTQEELAQHYLWRFWKQLPRAGKISIFDRSWYGRVLVERIEGFATAEEWKRAYQEICDFEGELVGHGTAVAKFWLHISKDEQKRRFEARQQVPYKRWKLTEEDWRNRDRWEEYEDAINDMIELTHTQDAPWVVVEGNNKRFARIKVLQEVCKALDRALHQHATCHG